MPFTFSHSAIVLPLRSWSPRWLSMTGLVMGSITPDFEYFLRMRMESQISHTWFGLFAFNLPVGIVLTFLFHHLVRDSLIENLPVFFKSRFGVIKEVDWKKYFKQHWMVVMTSVLLGAASHIFWDSFTHPYGYFVNRSPFLLNTLEWWGWETQVYDWIQQLSTVAGGGIVLVYVCKLPSQPMKSEGFFISFTSLYWRLVLFLSCAFFFVRTFFSNEINFFDHLGSYEEVIDFLTVAYGHLIVSAMSSGFLAILLAPLILKILFKNLQPVSEKQKIPCE